MDAQEYNKLKASDPDFYRAADSMSYGGAGKVPEANIDKMVAELNERQAMQELLGYLAALSPPPPPPLAHPPPHVCSTAALSQHLCSINPAHCALGISSKQHAAVGAHVLQIAVAPACHTSCLGLIVGPALLDKLQPS